MVGDRCFIFLATKCIRVVSGENATLETDIWNVPGKQYAEHPSFVWCQTEVNRRTGSRMALIIGWRFTILVLACDDALPKNTARVVPTTAEPTCVDSSIVIIEDDCDRRLLIIGAPLFTFIKDEPLGTRTDPPPSVAITQNVFAVDAEDKRSLLCGGVGDFVFHARDR